MVRLTRWLAALAALAVFSAGSVQAQVVKPFKIRGSGDSQNGLPLPGQPDVTHTIQGNATHLGRHTGVGVEHTATVDAMLPDGTILGSFGSAAPFVFTGANGDKLSCLYGRAGDNYVGTYMVVPVGTPGFGELYVAYFVADFVAVTSDCTGKFAGVTGQWTMFAHSEPFRLGVMEPFYYSWEGQGQLTFPNGN